MTLSRRLGKLSACVFASVALLVLTNSSIAQITTAPPNLGTAATYGAFSGAGAIESTGLTVVNGDIGTYVGSFTGFPPGQYTGAKHVADAAALAAKNDLTLAYNLMNDATHAVMYDSVLGATMGNGQVLYPATYKRGDLTTLTGDLTFDAMGDPAAVFVVKIGAALNVAKNSRILLAGGAQAANIYWAVNGSVSILDGTQFKGTILSNGAIHLYIGSTLEGRALAVVGAVTMASNIVSVPGGAAPGNTLVVVTPAQGEIIQGGTEGYQITWTGTGIGQTKTIEYSLDNGVIWTLVATATGDVFNQSWNVPDVASTQALVRVKDENNLTGVSGMFTIVKSAPAGSIIVVRPAHNEVIAGGTANHQITFTEVNSTPQKSFEYSLDGGLNWTLIGVHNTTDLSYTWASVPNVATTQARIRITDANGVVGISDPFTITATAGVGSIDALNLSGLDANNNIGNNEQLGISWTFTPDIGSFVKVEYSLDGMATWNTIATVLISDPANTVWTTPITGVYPAAFIRVTSEDGMTRTSAPFSISPIAAIVSDASSIGYELSNYPNPASSQTTIGFVLPVQSDVTMTIIDARGQKLGTIVSRNFDAGSHDVPLNTSHLPAGTYTYVLQTDITRLVGRLSIVK